MAVNCNVTNKTSVRVTPRATLKQTQTFLAKGKQKIKETKYLRVEGSPVDPGLTNVEMIQVEIFTSQRFANLFHALGSGSGQRSAVHRVSDPIGYL